MAVAAKIEQAVVSRGHALWVAAQGHLPEPASRFVRGPVRSALNRAGVATVPASRVRKVGGVKATSVWPGIAEKRDDALRGLVFEQLLGQGDGRAFLDLGAGPCQFSRRAVRLGWKVTAVDGRTERLPDDMTGIDFIEADVRQFDTLGYDTIAILGLLYHLPVADQLALLKRCHGSRVILETQIHTPGYVPPAAEPWGHRIVRQHGFRGVVFPEGDNPMASIGNSSSLWVTEDSFLEMADQAGFTDVQVVEPMHHSKYGTRRYYVLR